MILKPEKWTDLPYCVRETLVKLVDDLEYDRYESCRAEAIEKLLSDEWLTYGLDTPENVRRVQAFYEGLGNDGYRTMLLNLQISLKRQLDEVTDILLTH
jgi:hypothetical protein